VDGKGGAFVTSSDGTITRVELSTGAKKVVASKLSGPEGIDIAPDGRLVVAEVGAKRVVSVDPSTGAVTPIADELAIGLPSPEGQAPAFLTTGVAVAGDGTIYVAADLTNAVLKIVPAK
jgi:streptogramin lyase